VQGDAPLPRRSCERRPATNTAPRVTAWHVTARHSVQQHGIHAGGGRANNRTSSHIKTKKQPKRPRLAPRCVASKFSKRRSRETVATENARRNVHRDTVCSGRPRPHRAPWWGRAPPRPAHAFTPRGGGRTSDANQPVSVKSRFLQDPPAAERRHCNRVQC
jgi:hypothetical protein